MSANTFIHEPGNLTSLPNQHVCSTIINAIASAISSTTAKESRTELDSHANVVVAGNNCTILQNSGRTTQVSPFTPEYDDLTEVPIVDVAIAYDCPYQSTTHILVCHNALYVPALSNNLIPPFLMREAGIVVNDTPKIHVPCPSIHDHSIYFADVDIRIPLSLWGVFSYFNTRMPTLDELNGCDQVLTLTPISNTWDPHNSTYAHNEANMLDWEGNLIAPKDRRKIIIDDISEDITLDIASTTISSTESSTIDSNLNVDDTSLFISDTKRPTWDQCPSPQDIVSSVLQDVSNTLDPYSLAHALDIRGKHGRFTASVGSTISLEKEYLFPELIFLPTNNPKITPPTFDDEIDHDLFSIHATSAKDSKGVKADHLSKIWKIDLQSAKRTLDVTTQLVKHTADPSLSRNYSTNDRMLRYKRIREHFFMDTFFAKKTGGKSSRGNTCAQLFVTDKGFVHIIPLTSKSDVPKALKMFAKEIGAPDAIICDASGEQSSKEVKDFCHLIGTSLRYLEENTPWSNRAELYIGLIKESVRKDLRDSNSPLAFWDYCCERRARINNLTARNLFQLEGRNAHFTVTGDEGDISNLCQFGWYDWVYYREHKPSFPYPKEILGRVLGPSKGQGNEMSQWILKSNGKVVPRRTVRSLTAAEINSSTELAKRLLFDELITKKWGTSMSPPPDTTIPTPFIEYEDEDELPRLIPEIIDPVDNKGIAINTQPMYDKLIYAELSLPQNDQMTNAKVKGRTLASDGNSLGTYHDHPALNTIVYDVEFPDGEIREYAANTIAENMLAQVDSEGFTLCLLDSIIDYKRNDSAIHRDDMYASTKSGKRRMRKTTIGWKLLVKWKDGTTQWVPLKDMKESNPVETAEFATSRGIDNEAAFAWWVPYTLRKRDFIISSVKSRVRKSNQKYGIKIPTSIKNAHELDTSNGNTHWSDAISKEMTNVGIAFDILDMNQHVPVGWKPVTGRLIFDVKMDFTRKARWVLDGHKLPDPGVSTYAGVVSRESVRIALTYAALNDIDVYAADIQNAYLQAPSSQKHYITCGLEFGLEHVGKKALIRRALYGGKTAGRDFRNHLRECMQHMGFTSCKSDPDVWMRAATKSDGSTYWEYILLYVDDALCISETAESILRNELGKYFTLKESSIGPPTLYLGGRMRKVILENGAKAWAFGSSQYVQAAVQNVEDTLKKKGLKLPTRGINSPTSTNYRPEIDSSPELDGCESAYYQSLIGILRWTVELGRVDICCEVSMLSSHLALPRQGHLKQLYNIFAYLKKYHNAEMVFDPSDPSINKHLFERKDWTATEFGLTLSEELPSNMPEGRGQGFTMRAFVDADHAGDSITRRSRTGFLVYLNSAPIYWLSKKQTSVETSSFGSEFIAMKQCTEYVRGLRYKLRMMGIPCEAPTFIYGDNQSVLCNTAIPDSTLKKKSHGIAYHFVREGCARDEWRTAYINTHLNPADILTKPLAAGQKRSSFVRMILHHIFGTDG